MSWEMEFNDDLLEDLYEWIDKIPLSRPKKRIERDFADGYCVGEIVKHFLPQYIDMHMLTPAHNIQQKLANWGVLNSKVFSKFGLNVPLNVTQNISNCRPGFIEVFLYNLRYKIEEKSAEITNYKNHDKKKSSPRASLQMSSPFMNKNLKGPALQMRLDYEEKVQECLQQAEQIEILQAKVRRLEHLLDLKETRINDLTEKLDKFRPTGNEPPTMALLRKNNASSMKSKISAI